MDQFKFLTFSMILFIIGICGILLNRRNILILSICALSSNNSATFGLLLLLSLPVSAILVVISLNRIFSYPCPSFTVIQIRVSLLLLFSFISLIFLTFTSEFSSFLYYLETCFVSLGGRALGWGLGRLGIGGGLALGIGFGIKILMSGGEVIFGNQMMPTGSDSGGSESWQQWLNLSPDPDPDSTGRSPSIFPSSLENLRGMQEPFHMDGNPGASVSESPVPSISSQGDSWIERMYGDGDGGEVSSSAVDMGSLSNENEQLSLFSAKLFTQFSRNQHLTKYSSFSEFLNYFTIHELQFFAERSNLPHCHRNTWASIVRKMIPKSSEPEEYIQFLFNLQNGDSLFDMKLRDTILSRLKKENRQISFFEKRSHPSIS